MIPPRSDKRAWEIYRHGVELANIDGKELEISVRDSGDWYKRLKSNCGDELYWSCNDYRLAPEPARVVPWTFETIPTHRIKVRRKSDGKLASIADFPEGVIAFYGTNGDELDPLTYAELADQFEQLDGSCCGTVEESWPKWYTHKHNRCDHIWRQDVKGAEQYTWIEFRGVKRGETGVVALGRKDFLSDASDWREITRTEAEALLKGAK